jgi:hypothetical protein
MKRSLLVPSILVLFSFALPLFGQPTESEASTSVKVYGGWNTWVLGSAVLAAAADSGDTTSGSVSAGGFSFGADLLFGKAHGTQYGLGCACLPMLQGSAEGSGVSLDMIPIVVEACLNGSGNFYADLGLGLGFLVASLNSDVISSGTTSVFSPSPGFLAKVGLGFRFPISRVVGIDVGADAYLPFSDFGIISGSAINSAALDVIAFSQLNLRAGLSFDL